jgi:hypothetical protein
MFSSGYFSIQASIKQANTSRFDRSSGDQKNSVKLGQQPVKIS